MKKLIIPSFLTLLLLSCCVRGNEDVLDRVDPFIGTAGHGHTFPGAAHPFGAVQLSPDTGLEGWDWCSGYHRSDRSIIGFSHTHLSGTGRADLMDVMLMPSVGETKLVPGTKEDPDSGYRSRFNHAREWASPGYYKVDLLDSGVTAELTVSTGCGFHRYTFPESTLSHIILDLSHRFATDNIVDTSLEIVDGQTVTGSRHTRGWGEPGEKYWADQQLYFAIRVSKPFLSTDIEENVKAVLNFETEAGEQILVKVGISAVSVENALGNLSAEIPCWDFDAVLRRTQEAWRSELSKIEVDADEDTETIFYTALYHSLLAPSLYNDVNGQYRGFDGEIHDAGSHENYTVLSLWDTFRAENPLLTLLAPDRTNALIHSMLRQYREYGLLPVWPLWSSETNCMIGWHSIPVIVDAYFKGIVDWDVEEAYEAMKTSAMQDDFGVKELKKYGYIPYDKYNKSVSTALEYCFDDWCIARMAKELGKREDYEYFMRRAASYKTYFDREYGLMNGVSSEGAFRRPFDPFYSSYGECDWVEGNSWQYSFFVPHDVEGLMQLHGGREGFAAALDKLFSVSPEMSGGDVPIDITGLIGQYAHGNEPSHHVAYLYTLAGQPHKAQERLHEIMSTLYTSAPDGLCGNEDCGQMSAWYVFSALGFYPVNPASGEYVFGKPMVDKAVLRSGDKTFTVRAHGLNEKNIYIRSVRLNGKIYDKPYITHADIVNGGELEFTMSSEPLLCDKASITCRGDVYTLSTGDLSMSVSAAHGGRIVSFQRGGSEMLIPEATHPDYFGATFWLSPQSDYWPVSETVDKLPYEASVGGDTLRLVSGTGGTGIRIIKEFSMEPSDGGAVNIKYTMENISGKVQKVAAWDVARVHGGESFFPVGEPLPTINRSDLPETAVEEGILWFRHTPQENAKGQKLFNTARGGWMAHHYRDLLFVKCFPDIAPTETPPGQGEVEIFVAPAGKYIELENHGPYLSLEPGGAAVYVEKWFLLLPGGSKTRSELRRIVDGLDKEIPPHTVWLDELDLTKVDQSAGVARANLSMWRTPLSIAGEKFERGVGTHAAGIFRIRLDGKTTRFRALAGVDDSAPEHELRQASVRFTIDGDGKRVWESGTMHGGDKAREVDIHLEGVRSLILRVEHEGDGIVGDRANWVDARFEVAGADPVSVARERDPEYILTPPTSHAPQINAPYIYGARPGNPFLFTVAVSGERPVRITADKLPEGLSLDTATGIITGCAATEGTYDITVTATNRFGTETKTITLKIGDTISLTPPMGWNSWNIFGPDIDDCKIRDMADAIVSLGLNNYGYSYINIDDGWQGERGGKYNAIMPNEKFPDMKALVDYVHGKGLKIGIYSSPWVQTFAGYIGGSADTRTGDIVDPGRRYGEFSFVRKDVQQWAEWGFDYLKYDWVVNDIAHTAEMTYLLDNSGRDIVYSISNAAPFELAAEWKDLTNARRTTGDIFDSWCSMTTIGFLQDKWQPYARPGSWNDPDMLIVGNVGWGKDVHPTRLTPNEQYLHMSLWSILAAPLLIGCDLKKMDNFTLNIISNREVLEVNQDAAGEQGKRVRADEERRTEVWARPLSDGSLAVGLFNLSDTPQRIGIMWNELELTGELLVRNLWTQRDEGLFSDSYSSDVPPHGVTFVKITPVN